MPQLFDSASDCSRDHDSDSDVGSDRDCGDVHHPDLHAALRHDLQQLYGHAPPIPAALDARLLGAARTHLAALAAARRGLRRRQAIQRRLAGAVFAGAAAALLLLAIRGGEREAGQRTAQWTVGADHQSLAAGDHPAASRGSGDRLDLDGNGRVDIADALRLARALEAGGDTRDRDIDGDGTVGQADVDAIALAAVSLSRRSRYP